MGLRTRRVAPAWIHRGVEGVDGGSTRPMRFFGFEVVRPNAPVATDGERRRHRQEVSLSLVVLGKGVWRRGGRGDVRERRHGDASRDIDATARQAVAEMQLAGRATANPGENSRFRDRRDIGPGGLVVPTIVESR